VGFTFTFNLRLGPEEQRSVSHLPQPTGSEMVHNYAWLDLYRAFPGAQSALHFVDILNFTRTVLTNAELGLGRESTHTYIVIGYVHK
jgi:hypothetical protein